ncbi:GIP, partial [Symbiodinium necroappetens]
LWPKGKSKGKAKGKDGSRSVNAYMASEYFVGGLELNKVNELHSVASSDPPSAQNGLLDCGATASAAPEAIVQSLISAVLSQDKNARIELDQSASFSLYTLPNPAEYYQANFDRSALVPILIGMDFLGSGGVGMLIDFSTGLAMLSKEVRPEIFQLSVNKKGHFTMDIVHYLTNGQRCDEGQAHVVVRELNHSSSFHYSQQMLELWTAWIDLNVSDQQYDARELELSRSRLLTLYNHSRNASSPATFCSSNVSFKHRTRYPHDFLYKFLSERWQPPRVKQATVAVSWPASTGTSTVQPVGRMDTLHGVRLSTPLHPEEGRSSKYHIGDERTDREGNDSAPTVDGRCAANGTNLQAHDGQDHGGGGVEPAEVVLNKAIVERKAKAATSGYPSPTTTTSNWEHMDPDTELIAAYESQFEQEQ